MKHSENSDLIIEMYGLNLLMIRLMKKLEMIKTGKIHYLLLENLQKMFLSNTSENRDDSEYRSDSYNH